MEKKIADWLEDHVGCVFAYLSQYIIIIKTLDNDAAEYGNIFFNTEDEWSVGFLQDEELYELVVSRPVVARLPNFYEVLNELASTKTSTESDAELRPEL